MILIDTGYLLALTFPQDALHHRARAWAAVVREPLLLTEYVFLEYANHLSSPALRPRVHAFHDLLIATPQYEFIPSSSELLTSALELHRTHADKSWSLTDCLSFHLMAERKITRALAYDHHFEQAGFQALLRRDP
jgi:uncharacterized protein